MKILITGNMGYVGPAVVKQLRRAFPESTLIGVDTGFFANCTTNCDILPERRLDRQYFADVRDLPEEIFAGVDVVVHLAAISNDPMGNKFEEVTYAINHRASVALASRAKEAGVGTFVFASSCSMYGSAEGSARHETDALNPLTAYARSKVFTEEALKEMAGDGFTVTSLRFSTACGMSDRLRLDLVLNDFVACAVSSGCITILSDGTPWRPLIDVRDMARAIEWASTRRPAHGGAFLAVNVGSDERNYQVRDLAAEVARAIPGTRVEINQEALPDKRSYRVNFELFKQLAPQHQPIYDLGSSVKELKEGLQGMLFKDGNFRASLFMRLNHLNYLRENDYLSESLQWTPGL